jgi:hypothetical protein
VPPCLQDVDGVLLVTDPQHPEQEKALEQFYLRFAQPHNLTMKQCAVLGVSQETGSSWAGTLCGASESLVVRCAPAPLHP